jgi:SlyX protein
MIRSEERKPPADFASRLDDLEAQLAQQDQTLAELGAEVFRQQRDIARLEDQLRVLTERLKAFAAREPSRDPLEERPPHY